MRPSGHKSWIVKLGSRGLGLSQEELAERSGLHRNYLGGIERGERNVGVLAFIRLAEALDTTPSELFAELKPSAPR